MNDWITENIKELERICRNVSKQNDIQDLLQTCVEQFLKNKKTDEIPDEQKLYFFTRIVRNNYGSKTSAFYMQHKRFQFQELNGKEIVEHEYEEPVITMEWMLNEIEQLKKTEWYYGRLMELYLQEGCSITKLAQRTTIPINSVSRDINKVRKILKQKREQKLNNK